MMDNVNSNSHVYCNTPSSESFIFYLIDWLEWEMFIIKIICKARIVLRGLWPWNMLLFAVKF
jgi:hypothetical protein